jgi:hypothetical protein
MDTRLTATMLKTEAPPRILIAIELSKKSWVIISPRQSRCLPAKADVCTPTSRPISLTSLFQTAAVNLHPSVSFRAKNPCFEVADGANASMHRGDVSQPCGRLRRAMHYLANSLVVVLDEMQIDLWTPYPRMIT